MSLVSVPGLTSVLGLIVGVVSVVVLLSVLGVFVVVIVANRAEADPTGRRPLVVYLFGVAFITIWTALIGFAAVVTSIVQLIGSHAGDYGGALHPIGDATARGVVLGGLIMVVSLGAFRVHLRKGVELANLQHPLSGPAKRCEQSYAAAVAFASVVVVVIALVIGVYAIFETLAPGVFGGGGSVPSLRNLLDAVFIALGAGYILKYHLTLTTPQLWSRGTTTNEGPGASTES